MAIEYKTVTYRTVESANDNATYCWVELSASHVPAVNGLIKRIVIQGATTSATGMTTDPMYLGIWERQSDGGLIFLGCSKNAIVQAINQQNVWDFDGAIIRGQSLVLGLLSSPDEHWTNNTQLLLRSRVQTNDTDGCVILSNTGRIRCTPDITFTIDVPEYIPDEEPEPEPEAEEHRIVDISKYWIQIIRNTNEFKQIAIAENPEFNGLLDAIYRALKDGFILEATDYGVSRWEKILGLVVTEGMTLEDRKVQILTYLSVKLPYTWRVLKQMLTEYLGDGNFKMSIDNDTQTLRLDFTESVTKSKIAEVEQLLDRVLPMNLTTDLWHDGVPIEYTQLEYLESSGTQYIRPYLQVEGLSYRVKATAKQGSIAGYYDTNPYGECTSVYAREYADVETTHVGIRFAGQDLKQYVAERYKIPAETVFEAELNWHEGYLLLLIGTETKKTINVGDGFTNKVKEILIGVQSTGGKPDSPIGSMLQGYYTGKLYSFKAWYEPGVLYRDFVPVLDANGTPCLFDKVSRKCFYNNGKGSFGYRIKTAESDIMPLDLDDPYYTAPSGVWAKLIDENTLDIITALDPTVDESQGYKLFANTAEAYEYFNIKEVIENE